jgi:hypothetical protein
MCRASRECRQAQGKFVGRAHLAVASNHGIAARVCPNLLPKIEVERGTGAVSAGDAMKYKAEEGFILIWRRLEYKDGFDKDRSLISIIGTIAKSQRCFVITS